MIESTDAGMVERLEKATGPGKEIDRLIAKHIGWHHVEPRHSRRSNGAWIAPEDFNGTMSGGSPILDSLHGTEMHPDVPHYTSSIDAALTLVPEGWRVTHAYGPPWHWSLTRNDPTKFVEGKGATPALALCIAALRARSARA